MLDTLDTIPWSALEHAYGNAADIPNLFRALVSGDPDRREWAQDMLDIGPFHQGSLYSCTPFVVRVSLQPVQEKEVADLPWILQYVSRVLAAAISWLPGMEAGIREPEQAYATQILVEIRAKLPLLLGIYAHPDVHARLALLRLLMLLKADLPHLGSSLAEKVSAETDESIRVALVFCLGLVADDAPLTLVQNTIERSTESPLMRIAAGFGLIAAVKDRIADKALTAFCDVMAHDFMALDRFEDMYAEYLTPLGAPLGKDRLFDCLQRGWSARQRDQIVQALLSIYAQLPMAHSSDIRVGSAYYLATMVRLAFPEGKLPSEATIRDLNAIQRRILEAFQQYDMPAIKWNVYHLDSDYRTLLGFDFRSEADFLAFMSGERSARHTTQ